MKEYNQNIPDYRQALARIDLELVKANKEHIHLDVLDCGVVNGKEIMCFDAPQDRLKEIQQIIKKHKLPVTIPSRTLSEKLWFGSTKKPYQSTAFTEYIADKDYITCLRLHSTGDCYKCSQSTYTKCCILHPCDRLKPIHKLLARLRKIKC